MTGPSADKRFKHLTHLNIIEPTALNLAPPRIKDEINEPRISDHSASPARRKQPNVKQMTN